MQKNGIFSEFEWAYWTFIFVQNTRYKWKKQISSESMNIQKEMNILINLRSFQPALSLRGQYWLINTEKVFDEIYWDDI